MVTFVRETKKRSVREEVALPAVAGFPVSNQSGDPESY